MDVNLVRIKGLPKRRRAPTTKDAAFRGAKQEWNGEVRRKAVIQREKRREIDPRSSMLQHLGPAKAW
jgi:hypothetical protein